MSGTLRTDFFVVGAGAMGLAFADEVLRTTEHDVILVDRRAGPGGHWNDAYDFVRLHQPAAFYGVNSQPLGPGGAHLAGKAEILTYFQRVVERWQATGRLRYMPQCEMGPDWRLRSLVDARSWVVETTRPIVDATFSDVRVPATHPPNFAVAPDAALVPVGGLWNLREAHPRYVIIGAGKTGLDAMLYLLQRGVDPDRITWIVSRDAWLFPRDALAPSVAANQVIDQLDAIRGVGTVDAAIALFEARGWWTRLDRGRRPEMFRCATVSAAEVEELRRVKRVVRLGRVQRVEADRVVLDGGTLPVEAGALFVDCTADGLRRRSPTPVFTADRITLQPIFVCQQVMSAAAVAAIATGIEGDAARNALTEPVPHPDVPADYLRCLCITLGNVLRWLEVPWLTWWTARQRLSASSHLGLADKLRMGLSMRRWGPEALATLKALTETAGPPERPDQSAPGS